MQNTNDTIQSDDPKSLILEALKAAPGQKASDLSIELDIEKKEINKLLYGELKNACVQDEKYCWYLNKDAPARIKDDKKTIPKTALASLAQYYLSCIGHDEGGISVFAESKYGDLDYAE